MTKSHYDYNEYTPELVAELKDLVANVPRADGVKKLMKRLGISDRSARRVYSKYVEGDAEFDKEIERMKVSLERTRKLVDSMSDGGRPIRRLFWDIESAPNIGLFWRSGFKLNVGPENIIKERAIICIGYKWEHEKQAHILYWDENQDDKAMLSEFIKILSQADEQVGHNIDRFDMPWLRTRALYHGLPPIPDVRQIDSLKWARSKFYFNSNKLDYIAKFLGLSGKIKTEFGLWKDVLLNRCPKALAKMGEYCKYDVVLLEQVWKKLSELMPAKTHVGVLGGGERWQCPKTGSTDVCVSKTRVTAAGVVQYQMKNRATGSFYTISSAAHDAYLEAKGR